MAGAPSRKEAGRATAEQLAALDPLATLSPGRLKELADLARVERAERGSDPLAGRTRAKQSIFLLKGELLLMFEGGGTLVVVGGLGDGRYPVNRRKTRVARSRAISDVELLSLDDEVLDILVTFDQLAAGTAAAESAMAQAVRSDAGLGWSAFSLANLRHGVFARLHAARIDELLA